MICQRRASPTGRLSRAHQMRNGLRFSRPACPQRGPAIAPRGPRSPRCPPKPGKSLCGLRCEDPKPTHASHSFEVIAETETFAECEHCADDNAAAAAFKSRQLAAFQASPIGAETAPIAAPGARALNIPPRNLCRATVPGRDRLSRQICRLIRAARLRETGAESEPVFKSPNWRLVAIMRSGHLKPVAAKSCSTMYVVARKPGDFGAQDEIACKHCGEKMLLSRRSPHPQMGDKFEEQHFTCLKCKREAIRCVDENGNPPPDAAA